MCFFSQGLMTNVCALNRDISALFFHYMGQSKLFLQIFAAKRRNYLADTLNNLWKRRSGKRHGKDRFAQQFDNRWYCLMQSDISVYT
jgi:hypothetical protein